MQPTISNNAAQPIIKGRTPSISLLMEFGRTGNPAIRSFTYVLRPSIRVLVGGELYATYAFVLQKNGGIDRSH